MSIQSFADGVAETVKDNALVSGLVTTAAVAAGIWFGKDAFLGLMEKMGGSAADAAGQAAEHNFMSLGERPPFTVAEAIARVTMGSAPEIESPAEPAFLDALQASLRHDDALGRLSMSPMSTEGASSPASQSAMRLATERGISNSQRT